MPMQKIREAIGNRFDDLLLIALGVFLIWFGHVI